MNVSYFKGTLQAKLIQCVMSSAKPEGGGQGVTKSESKSCTLSSGPALGIIF